MKLASRRSGFSMIELLVVIAMISLISLFAIPTISSYFKISLNSATRELASAVKEAYHSTIVTGKLHRVVYDLKKNEFWVESAPVNAINALMDTEESLKKAEDRRRFSTSFDEEREKAKKENPYQLEKSITRKKKPLPRGVVFEDVQTEQRKAPITEGLAYTHMFPHGVIEQTLVHLRDTDNHQISLVIPPVGGSTTLIERSIKYEEAFDQK